MKTLPLSVAVAAAVVLAVSASAGPSRIEGAAVDSNGRALKNAQVRIWGDNSKAEPVVVKTDGKGHFVATLPSAGTYNVSVFDRGAVVSSARHVKVETAETMRLNLMPARVQTAAGSPPAPHKKRLVWVAPATGTSFGGHYQEVDDSSGTRPDAQNIDRVSGAGLRMQAPVASRSSMGMGGR